MKVFSTEEFQHSSGMLRIGISGEKNRRGNELTQVLLGKTVKVAYV